MKKKIVLIAAVILISLGLLSISKIVQNKYLNKNSVSTNEKANNINLKEENTAKEINLKEANKDKQDDRAIGSEEPKEEIKPIIKDGTTTKVESKTETEPQNPVDTKTESKTAVSKTPSDKSVKVVNEDKVTKVPSAKKEPNLIIKDDISGEIILSINISTDNKTVGQITLSELEKNGISYKASGRGTTVYFTMINNLKAREFGPLSGWCYYVNGTKASVSCGAYKLKSSDVVEWKYLEDGVNN